MGGRTRNSTPQPQRAKPTPQHAARITALLAQTWPDAVVELDHRNAFELLVATILSAQSTDKTINTITPALFAKYPDARALAQAEPAEVEPLIYKSGFFRNKAKSIVGMARALVERHGGEVPRTMAELVELPGVARKTANVILGSALGINAGIVVDTHVTRLAQRLGLTANTDPVKIEQDLMGLVPQAEWTDLAHRLIWHGRRVCHAKQPDCEHCRLAPVCPSAGLFAVAADKPAAKTKAKEKAKAKPPAKPRPAAAAKARR